MIPFDKSIFELGMLVCFGVAWPFSIHKSWISRSVKGKSFFFLLVVLLGYAFGIAYKIMNGANYVVYFYLLNAFMVITDISIYIRNLRLEQRETKTNKIIDIV